MWGTMIFDSNCSTHRFGQEFLRAVCPTTRDGNRFHHRYWKLVSIFCWLSLIRWVSSIRIHIFRISMSWEEEIDQPSIKSFWKEERKEEELRGKSVWNLKTPFKILVSQKSKGHNRSLWVMAFTSSAQYEENPKKIGKFLRSSQSKSWTTNNFELKNPVDFTKPNRDMKHVRSLRSKTCVSWRFDRQTQIMTWFCGYR
jgi:predicted RNA-binding protein YlxR (DUF448 family)